MTDPSLRKAPDEAGVVEFGAPYRVKPKNIISVDLIKRANAAVAENVKPDGSPKLDDPLAHGFACALSAVQQALSPPPADDDVERVEGLRQLLLANIRPHLSRLLGEHEVSTIDWPMLERYATDVASSVEATYRLATPSLPEGMEGFTEDALATWTALQNVATVYVAQGIRSSTDVPFSWYVVGPEGEVAYCQTEDSEQHAEMIAAALNDRVAMCAVRQALATAPASALRMESRESSHVR